MNAIERVTHKYDVIDSMDRFGGAFVRFLAVAWRHADDKNELALREAFPDIWAQYERMARERSVA